MPHNFKLDGFNLGEWVTRQRTNQGKRQLSAEQKQKLDDAGFIFDLTQTNWQSNFERLKEFFNENGHSNVKKGYIDQYNFKLANWVHQQRHSKESISVDQKKLLDAIDFDWDPLQTNWETSLGDLLVFKKHYGHVRVPATYKTSEGRRLGKFVSTIRTNKENLSNNKIQKLEALDFIWDLRSEKWEEGFSNLQQFEERERNCWVLRGHEEGDYNLGSWVIVQRSRRDKLTPERIERLDALGFVWDPQTEKWEEGFSDLQQFKKREGNCRVSHGHKEGDHNLGFWVATQRSHRDKLTPERAERLDALGFVWDVLTDEWEKGFSNLQQFREREGNCRVSRRHKEGDFNLGDWASRQRAKKDSTPPERKQRLDDIGFFGNSRDKL